MKITATQVQTELKAMAFDKTQGKCYYCGRQLTLWIGKSNSFTVDHIKPTSRGGERIKESNIAPCCLACNAAKGDKTLGAWRYSLGKGTKFYFEEESL